MYSTTIVIILLSVGSVVMDSNIKELCSKEYFDSYWASYSTPTGSTYLRLSRKVNETTYHSWEPLIKYQSNRFKIINEFQYLLKEGQTRKISLSQKRDCVIDIVHRRTLGGTKDKPNQYDWVLKDLVVLNSVNGPTVRYTHKYMSSPFTIETIWSLNENLNPNQSLPLLLPPTLNESIWFSGLLCATKENETTIYLIAGKAKSMSDSNRTQFVGRLRIDKNRTDFIQTKIRRPEKKYIYDTSLTFSLELINQTVIQFLGIDCQNITTNSTIPTISWNWFPQTKTLYPIFWSLVISGAILSIIDYLLVIKRRQPKISENTDRPSDLTSSPGESTTTTTSASTSTSKTGTASGPKKPKDKKVKSSNEKTMDTLTLRSDTK